MNKRRKSDSFHILFVCTGNICRSPMAEGLLQKKINEEGLADRIMVESAGIGAWEGLPASQEAIAVARDHGIDISGHRSQPVDLHTIKAADLILCATPEHARILQRTFPQFTGKIFTMRGFGRNGKVEREAIEDPIGRSQEVYQRVFRIIQEEVERIWPLIREQALRRDIG